MRNFIIWQGTAGDKASKADFTNYLVACDKKVGTILDHVGHGLRSLQRLSDFCADNPCFDLKELMNDIYCDRVECDTWGDANQMIIEFVYGGLSLIDSLRQVILKTVRNTSDQGDLVVEEDVATVAEQKVVLIDPEEDKQQELSEVKEGTEPKEEGEQKDRQQTGKKQDSDVVSSSAPVQVKSAKPVMRETTGLDLDMVLDMDQTESRMVAVMTPGGESHIPVTSVGRSGSGRVRRRSRGVRIKRTQRLKLFLQRKERGFPARQTPVTSPED